MCGCWGKASQRLALARTNGPDQFAWHWPVPEPRSSRSQTASVKRWKVRDPSLSNKSNRTLLASINACTSHPASPMSGGGAPRCFILETETGNHSQREWLPEAGIDHSRKTAVFD